MHHHIKNDSNLKELMSPTPFHLEPGWFIEIENQNKNCSHNQIDTLLAKKLINSIDIEIMKLLTTYRYVNTYNIGIALSYTLDTPYQKKSYASNLKKLVQAGIILRHHICTDSQTVDATNYAAPLRFYSLSTGAYTYMAPLTDHTHSLTSNMTDRKIVEQLALSQFLIHFHMTHGGSCKHLSINKQKRIGTHSFFIDAYIQCSVKPDISFSRLGIFVLSSRNCENGIKDILARIHFLNRWIHQHEAEFPFRMLLILVEDIQTIEKIYRGITSFTDGLVAPLYYCVDTTLLFYPIFSTLFQCRLDEDTYKIIIERQTVSL